MKIAIIADPLDRQYAGPHTVTKELVRALTGSTEDEIIIVRPKPGGEFKGAKEIIVPIYPYLPGHQTLRLFARIPWILSKEGVDLVIEPAHFGPFNLPHHIKRVTVIYDLTPILFPKFHIALNSVLHRLFLPRIIRNADRIITCSEHSKKDILKVYPNATGKVAAIHLGAAHPLAVDPQPRLISQADTTRSAYTEMHEAGQTSVAPYFLFVGTIEPRKNLTTLLNAFELFKRTQTSKFRLVIAGKRGWRCGDFFDTLERHPFRDEIEILGYVNSALLPKLYSEACAFIYPSIYEGFGLPIADAMAYGTPVIISNSSSLPEVGGDAALYFEPDSTSDLAEAMSKLAFDQKERQMRSQLCLAQSNKFTWSSFGQDIRTVIDSLRGQNAPATEAALQKSFQS